MLASCALALAACGNDGEPAASSTPSSKSVEVSAACSDAMQATAAELNLKQADELIFASLDVCQSADEWMSALRSYPGAIGVRDATFIDDSSLNIVCGPEQNSTAVCSDASARGFITTIAPAPSTTTLPLTDAQREELTVTWAQIYSYDIEMAVISIGEELAKIGDAAMGTNAEFELSQACVAAIPTLEAAEASGPYGDPDALPSWTAIVDSFRDIYDGCAIYGADGIEAPLAELEAAFTEFDAWWIAHGLPSVRE